MAGKRSGFLTEPRREYIRMPLKDRAEYYSESQRIQHDAAIHKQATVALEDLILIARGGDEEMLKNIFSKDAMTELLDVLMDRIGMDEVGIGQLYYEIPVRAIEQRIRKKYLEHQRFFKLEESEFPLLPSKPAYRDVKDYMKK
jgi:hypothetical protein